MSTNSSEATSLIESPERNSQLTLVGRQAQTVTGEAYGHGAGVVITNGGLSGWHHRWRKKCDFITEQCKSLRTSCLYCMMFYWACTFLLTVPLSNVIIWKSQHHYSHTSKTRTHATLARHRHMLYHGHVPQPHHSTFRICRRTSRYITKENRPRLPKRITRRDPNTLSHIP